jgi:hypothetical protein
LSAATELLNWMMNARQWRPQPAGRTWCGEREYPVVNAARFYRGLAGPDVCKRPLFSGLTWRLMLRS